MDEDHDITAKHLQELPIFPLSKVVLFPDTIVPLHIFEPRYRELTRYCIENDWPLAIANIDLESEPAKGQPAVMKNAGAGFIAQHQELPDGRYNILVKGIRRIHLHEELERDFLFRVVKAELADDISNTTADLNEKVQTLRACLVALGNQAPSAGDAIHRHVLSVTDPAVMTNILSSMMLNDPAERQRMLEQRDVAARLDTLTDKVSELLVEIGPDSSDMH